MNDQNASNPSPTAARLQLILDSEFLRMQNEWFFLWHHIGGEPLVEIDGFNGRMIKYSGIKFSGSAHTVFWDTIQRYLRQKIGSLCDDLEGELQRYPIDTRRRTLNEAKALMRNFARKIRRAAVEKDQILRGDGINFPEERDFGQWTGSRLEDIDAKFSSLVHTYCDLEVAKGDGYLFDDMMNDRVSLVKKDGTVFKKDIKALVTKGKVQIHDPKLPIEVGDHLLRELPSGLVEDYLVDDPVLHSGLASIEAFYIVHVTRTGGQVQPQAAIQSITAHFHGDNARMNIQSTDNSTNTTVSYTVDKLQSFLDQVKPALSGLPEAPRTAMTAPLALLEDEVRRGSPSPSKVAAALQSIKTVAEGVAGNLIATGIAGMAASMMTGGG